jgi:hypothetical protein
VKALLVDGVDDVRRKRGATLVMARTPAGPWGGHAGTSGVVDLDRALLGALALVVVEHPLAQPQALGRDLDEFVVGDEREGLL